MAEPNSAYTKAPKKVNMPAITHTKINQKGAPTWPAISEGFLKIPEPMMLPIITEVADQKPNLAIEEDEGLLIKILSPVF